MREGSTLLVTPCEVPTTDFGLVPTKSLGVKRRNIEIGERCSSIPIPHRKRLRRDTSSESRLSKVSWKDVLEEQCGPTSLPSNEYSDEESEDSGTSSTIAESETWYSVSLLFLCVLLKLRRMISLYPNAIDTHLLLNVETRTEFIEKRVQTNVAGSELDSSHHAIVTVPSRRDGYY